MGERNLEVLINGDLAPIVLFTYNRPRHTKATLDALKANHLVKQSVLYIYQDGLKENATKEQRESVLEVDSYLQDFITSNENSKYFKEITLIQRERNFGLADSIIDGVTNIINKYGTIIVLEDDIVVSPVFLDFMNAALSNYKDQPKVWSIAGWGYPITTQDLGTATFGESHTAGVGQVGVIDGNILSVICLWILKTLLTKATLPINLDGAADYFSHFTLNHKGKLKTWAIFNYLIAHKHNALVLCPSISYIHQIGFDGSGVHCGEEGNMLNPPSINTKFPIIFPKDIAESALALDRIRSFELVHKNTIPRRIRHKLVKVSTALQTKLSHLIVCRGGGYRLSPVAYTSISYNHDESRAA